MKMWAGRFAEETNKEADEFNSSLRFDKALAESDIDGSIAHVSMLGSCNIIPKEDTQKAVVALEKLKNDILNNGYIIEEKYEDIHMAVESILTAQIGDAAKKIHTARSRNDQVALDMKMYIKDCINVVVSELTQLIATLKGIAYENLETIMPGYTHMQKAQPITLAHHLSAYIEMFIRDNSRLRDCYKRMNLCPLGSGALACSTFDIDRNQTSSLLGFDAPTRNSLDSVSDRDYLIEMLSDFSVIMMHLSRFSEEIIIWSTEEFAFITLSDSFSTGSSMMPQKKNPDMAELIRGKTGRVYGNLVQMLVTMKGLPLAYNKDMQEDKEGVFDSINTVVSSIRIFNKMIASATFNKDKMKVSVENSFVNATDMAEYLVKKGCPFRDAHFVVGALVKKAIDSNRYLHDFSLTELKEASDIFSEDIFEVLMVQSSIKVKTAIGSPNPDVMNKYLDALEY